MTSNLSFIACHQASSSMLEHRYYADRFTMVRGASDAAFKSSFNAYRSRLGEWAGICEMPRSFKG